jgi:hypothetical protein
MKATVDTPFVRSMAGAVRLPGQDDAQSRPVGVLVQIPEELRGDAIESLQYQ